MVVTPAAPADAALMVPGRCARARRGRDRVPSGPTNAGRCTLECQQGPYVVGARYTCTVVAYDQYNNKVSTTTDPFVAVLAPSGTSTVSISNVGTPGGCAARLYPCLLARRLPR